MVQRCLKLSLKKRFDVVMIPHLLHHSRNGLPLNKLLLIHSPPSLVLLSSSECQSSVITVTVGLSLVCHTLLWFFLSLSIPICSLSPSLTPSPSLSPSLSPSFTYHSRFYLFFQQAQSKFILGQVFSAPTTKLSSALSSAT